MKRIVIWSFLLMLLTPMSSWADAGLELQAPVPGALLKAFNPGTSRYSAGHRGVDLAAARGEAVHAAAVGKVYFAGMVAGTPSVSVDHGNGLRTTYTPVVATVSVGEQVAAGQVIGHIADASPHCAPDYCLHWGLTDGLDYHDPMIYLSRPPIRLLPHGTEPAAVTWLPPAQATGPGTGGSLPVEGPITSPFGMRLHPVTGIYKLHDGVDIGAPCGAQIRLPWAGKVTSAGNHGGYGYRVVIAHGNGRQTAYAHLSAIEVGVGQEIPAGGVVGHVGNTGYSTGCHLHWMAWEAGNLINPLTLVA